MMFKNYYVIKIFMGLVLFSLTWGCSNSVEFKQSTPVIRGYSPSQEDPKQQEDNYPKILQDINNNLTKLNACEGEIDHSTSQEMSSVYPINKKQYIVEFLCFLGAYQGNYEYFLYDQTSEKTKITPLSLAVFESNSSGKLIRNNVNLVGGIPDYEPQQQVLTVLTKYRGLGDCGSLGKYKWEGKKFKLLEYRVKEACDGTYLEPEKYAKVYP